MDFYTERKSPRISINKLAEYLDAHATRRKTIVRDQKFVPKVKVQWYNEARPSLVKYFTMGFDENQILNTIDEIENSDQSDLSDFKKQAQAVSLQLLKTFLENTSDKIFDYFDLSKFDDIKFTNNTNNDSLYINEVEVSVRPEILIETTYKKQIYRGAIKLIISKSVSLSEDSKKCVATAVQQYLDKYIVQSNEKSEKKLCLAIDVFDGKFAYAPNSYKRMMGRVADACDEIGLWWNIVSR